MELLYHTLEFIRGETLLKLQLFIAKWKLIFKAQNKIKQRFLITILLFLSLLFVSLGLGQSKFTMLLSGNPSIYQNLPILWNEDPLKVHIIDVGQGDATLIQFYDKSFLIDAGPLESVPTIIRYLDNLGLRKLNALIITHPHDDHVGGALEILHEFKVDQILLSHDACDNTIQVDLIKTAHNDNIPVDSPFRGTILRLGDFSLTCLHPLNQSYANVNNYSSVWKLSYINTSMLFLGDLEKDEFDSLTTGPVDFFRTGHHGSKTSLTSDLLMRLSPSLTAISCGLNNSFGHPSEEVLEMLRASDSPYIRTDQDGTVVFSSNGNFLRWVH